MFSGLFTDMNGKEIASLLSCLVHDENSKDEKTSVRTPKLAEKFSCLIDHARRVHKIFVESKINIDEVMFLIYF